MRPLFRRHATRRKGHHRPARLCGHCLDGAHGMFCEGCECWCAGDPEPPQDGPEPRQEEPARPAWWRRLSGAPARFLAYVGAGEPWPGALPGGDIADIFSREVMPHAVPGLEAPADGAHMNVPRPGPAPGRAARAAGPGHPAGPAQACGRRLSQCADDVCRSMGECAWPPATDDTLTGVVVVNVNGIPVSSTPDTVTLAVMRPEPRPGPPAWQPPGAAGQYARHLRDLQRGLPAACGWVAAILDPRWQPRALEAAR